MASDSYSNRQAYFEGGENNQMQQHWHIAGKELSTGESVQRRRDGSEVFLTYAHVYPLQAGREWS
jgi:hypothetical protein